MRQVDIGKTEISQSQEDKHCSIPFYLTGIKGKLIEPESRMVEQEPEVG